MEDFRHIAVSPIYWISANDCAQDIYESEQTSDFGQAGGNNITHVKNPTKSLKAFLSLSP